MSLPPRLNHKSTGKGKKAEFSVLIAKGEGRVKCKKTMIRTQMNAAFQDSIQAKILLGLYRHPYEQTDFYDFLGT